MAFDKTIAEKFAEKPRLRTFTFEPFKSATSPNFGVATGNLARNDFIHAIPFQRVAPPPGPEASYTTVSAPTDPGSKDPWPGSGDPPIYDFASMPGDLESTVNDCSTDFARLEIYVQMDRYQAKHFSSVKDILDVLLAGARSIFLRELTRKVFAGSGTSQAEPVGLHSQLVGDQKKSLSSGVISLDDVVDLMDMISPAGELGTGGRLDCFVTPPAVSNKLRKLQIASSVSPVFEWDKRTGRHVYYLMGIPVYDVDVAPYEANKYQMYAARLGGPGGIRVLYAAEDERPFGMEVQPLVDDSKGQFGAFVSGYYAVLVPEFYSDMGTTSQGAIAMAYNFALVGG